MGHHGDFIPAPDFVVLGVPAPDGNGVWVVGSQTLTLAEVRQALEHDFGFKPDGGRFVNDFTKAFELSCTMRDLQWATGPDYGAAVRNLFASWTPQSPSRPAVAPQAALGAPTPALERETGVGWAKRAR